MSRRENFVANIIKVLFLTMMPLALFACTPQSPQESVLRSQQEIDSLFMLKEADAAFYKSISLREHESVTDNIYYTGVISEELEGMLDDLVNAYNADPLTAGSVTAEDIRYNLTEGIVRATEEKNKESYFMQFLRWTKIPAGLVYKVDTPLPDGSIMPKGKTVANPPTNYEFITKRNDEESLFAYYEYSWEQVTR